MAGLDSRRMDVDNVDHRVIRIVGARVFEHCLNIRRFHPLSAAIVMEVKIGPLGRVSGISSISPPF